MQRKIADVAEYKGSGGDRRTRWRPSGRPRSCGGYAPSADSTKAEKAAAERAAKEAARDAIKAENMAKAFAANGGAFFAMVTSPKQAAPERPAPPAGPVGDPQSGSGGAGGV